MGHTIASVAVGGGVWAVTGEPLAVPAATVVGVLNDTDHIPDFYLWYVKKDFRHVFLLFHGWEYSAIGLALVLGAWYHPILLAGVLGHLAHMVGDQIGNRPVHPLAYSIVFRAYTRFDRSSFGDGPPGTLSDLLHRTIPLWGLVEPPLLRLALRLKRRR